MHLKLCVFIISFLSVQCDGTCRSWNSSTECSGDCLSNPCPDGATCVIRKNGGFICECPPGLSSYMCGKEDDPCQPNPCLNNGQCSSDSAGRSCNCQSGYFGRNCESFHRNCSSIPCENNGICETITGDDGYKCSCIPGTTGKNCESVFSPCDPDPCLNNGTCKSTQESFMCSCQHGFTGETCAINIDDCRPNICQNNGTCQDEVNNYKCICTSAFMGRHCEKEYNACASDPCNNGGICNSVPPSKVYTCSCLEGFEGYNCEQNVDDCKDVVCEKHQICYDLVNDHECRCPDGFSGSNCSENINECDPNPCLNGGACTDGIANFSCSCLSGFNGKQCEIDVDECEQTPCRYGICKNVPGSYECYCRPGFSGDHCTMDIDECLSAPCRHGGTCQDLVNGYLCVCAPGYTGVTCDIDIDDCEPRPCYNNATCEDKVNAYRCHCLPGFTSNNCETDIDECESQPCQNDGQCLDHINSFTCNCIDTGFEGLFCEKNIDDCLSVRCFNNATCEDLVKNYHCNCFDGYDGKHCETDIDECASHPCANEGLCLERSNYSLYSNNYLGLFPLPFRYEDASGYVCHCVPGFRGENCSENIDDCEQSPCFNGTCVDGINNYTCDCLRGFEGRNCELEIDECIRFFPCYKSLCVNTIGDYVCQCPLGYGGKNCSVELIGCNNNSCQHNATCQPYLVGEEIHKYNCSCVHGFYGTFCEKVTTISLNGLQPLQIGASKINGYSKLSFRFRTTLPDGILFSSRNGSGSSYILTMNDGKMLLFVNSSGAYKVYQIESNALNDANWYSVIIIMSSNVTVKIETENNKVFEKWIPLDEQVSWTFFDIVIGNAPQPELGTTLIPFVGCLEDVLLDHELVSPTSLFVTTGITEGCPRKQQCVLETCSRHGTCTDLWHTFQCECQRPYLGKICNDSITAGTFGHETTTSLATATFSLKEQEALKMDINVSLFIRTRESEGVIFYLGESNPSQDMTFVAAVLSDAQIKIVIKSGAEVYPILLSPYLNDGFIHFLEVAITKLHYSTSMTVEQSSLLLVSLNSSVVVNRTIDLPLPFTIKQLFLGSFPTKWSRRQRQTPAWFQSRPELDLLFSSAEQNRQMEPDSHPGSRYETIQPLIFEDGSNIDVTTDNHDTVLEIREQPLFTNFPHGNSHSANSVSDVVVRPLPADREINLDPISHDLNDVRFKGVLQDIRVNGQLVTLYPIAISGIVLPPAFPNVTLSSVMKGTVSDETCKDQPCKKGNCSVTWNDYICACPPGFRGKNCSLVDYCHENSCPARAICISLDYGFECVANATFNTSSFIRYKGRLDSSTQLDTFTFNFRTQKSGTILTSCQVFTCISISVWNDRITILNGNDNGASPINLTFRRTLTDGSWHWARIKFADGQITAQIDSEINFVNINNSISQMLTKSEITVGNHSSFSSQHNGFHGCLRELRLGPFLLPFITEHLLRNDTSTEQFIIEQSFIADDGECILCSNASCQHNGFCLTPYESFDCKCNGFTGQYCETDIDECLMIEPEDCKYGNCLNTDGSYNCICQHGFTGSKCESDIDECEQPICLNGGTCLNGLGNFSCLCDSKHTGSRCENVTSITCDQNPCENGGNCENDVMNEDDKYKYQCHCAAGYEGRNCEEEINFCTEIICNHNGNCVNQPSESTYHCDCADGYNGRHCENEIDECTLYQCENGGSCIDKIAGFECLCLEGFGGELCETDKDECQLYSGLCENGGTCHNMHGSYSCSCANSYFGKNCSFPDPCEEDNKDCATGGICTPDETNSTGLLYICNCHADFTGKFCDEKKIEAFNANNLALILGPLVGFILIITIIGFVVFLMMARKKRATRGTYSPSRQEMFGSRVEMGHVMKPPPEERLI